MDGDVPVCPPYSVTTNFPTQAHGKQKNSDYSNRCAIKSPPYRLSIKEQRSIYRLHAGVAGEGGVCSLMPPNNTPVYSVLGLPLLNTFLTFQRLHSIQKSAKRDPRSLFSPPLGWGGGHKHTMIPWELPGIWLLLLVAGETKHGIVSVL